MDNDALLKLGPALAQYISYAMAALSCLSVFSALVAWRKRRNEQVPARCSTLAEIDAALSTSWDAFSEAVPGVLVVVGLLGTFFGLAQAISEAGHAIQTHPITVSGAGALDQPRPDILSGLMPVLAGMGVKFKSSIWGISSSLVMRAFAHVFVRAPRKRRALAKFRELSEQPDRLQQVCDELRAQQDLFDQMLDEERRQSAAASKLLAANGAQAEALLQRHDEQKQVQDSLLKSVGGMAQQMPTATGLQSIANKLDLLKKTLDASLQEQNMARQILAANGAQAEALLQRHDEQKQVQDSLLKSVGGMAQQMPTATGLQSIANKLDLLKKTLDASLQEQNMARQSLAVLGTTAFALSQGAAGISNAASQMATAADNLQSALDALKAETKNMADAGVSQMKEGQKALTKATADLKTGIDEAMAGFQEKVTQAMTQMTTDLSGVTSGIQEAVDRSSGNLRDGVEGLTTSVGALDSRIGTALGRIETAVGDLAKHTNALNAQIEVMRQAEEQQKDVNARMVKVVENVAQEAAKIAQQVRAGERNNLKQVVDAVDALTVQVTQGNTTVCTGLGDVVKTIQDSGRESRALSRSSGNLRDGVEGLTTSVGALDSRIGTALGRIETAVGDLAKHTNALNAQIEVMRQAEEQQKDVNARMVKVVENVAQEAAKIAQQVRAGERNNLKQVVDAVDALTVQVTQGNTTVCTGLGDVVKTIQDSGRESRALSEKLAGTLAPLGQAATQASATKPDVQREDALSTNAAGARDAQGVKVTIALAGSGAAGVAPGSPAATPQSPSSSGPPQAANARPGSPVGPRVQAPPSAPVAAPIPRPPVHTPAPVASGVRPAAGPPPATAAAGAAGATGASPPAPAQAKSIVPPPPAVVPANKKG